MKMRDRFELRRMFQDTIVQLVVIVSMGCGSRWRVFSRLEVVLRGIPDDDSRVRAAKRQRARIGSPKLSECQDERLIQRYP